MERFVLQIVLMAIIIVINQLLFNCNKRINKFNKKDGNFCPITIRCRQIEIKQSVSSPKSLGKTEHRDSKDKKCNLRYSSPTSRYLISSSVLKNVRHSKT